jgi:hypothetical protein
MRAHLISGCTTKKNVFPPWRWGFAIVPHVRQVDAYHTAGKLTASERIWDKNDGVIREIYLELRSNFWKFSYDTGKY